MDYALNLLPLSVLFQAVAIFLGCLVLLYFISKNRNVILIYMEIVLLGMFFFILLQSFALWYNNPILLQIATTFVALSIIWIVILIDYIWYEKANVVHTGIACILSTLYINAIWMEDSLMIMTQNGSPYMTWSISYLIFAFIAYCYVVIFFGFWIIMSWRKCPPNMKSTMNMFVWGVLFFILGTIILWVVFGLVIAKFFSVLAIVFVIAGLKNMKLFYILPFTANRITVIDVKSGQCMYDLMWSPTPINKILLAGLIKGLDQITNQIFSQRHIREVKLDNGVLLLHHCNHISVGLLVSRSSNYLKLCLAKFSQEFDQTFYADNAPFNDDLRRFSNASNLISKYFGNIPTRISERQFLS